MDRRSILIAACLAWPPLARTPLARAEVRPSYGGQITAPLASRVFQLDPARASRSGELEVIALLYDAPFALDAAGRPQMRLASALDQTDPLRARLTLRPGLAFHDGRPLAAADVAASLTRAAKEPAGWPLAPIRAARALSELVVEIELTRPTPELAALLASPAASVTPGGLPPSLKCVGSGPFKLVSIDAGSIRLVENPASAEGRPFLDALQLKPYRSRAEEAGSYEVGSAQVSLHGATAFEGGAPKHPTAVTDGPRTITAALAFGRGAPAPVGEGTEPQPGGTGPRALDDPTLRRAIAAAIDRERLRRLAVREPATAAAGLAPGQSWPLMEPARARARIARATAPGRLRAALMIDASREGDRDLADKLLADLAEDGIDLAVDPVEPRTFAERLAAARFDLALVEAPGGAADQPGMAALALIAAVDPQLARALLARAPADPQTAAKAVDERALLTPLFHRAVRAHHRADLRGLSIDPAGRLDFAAVWLAPR